MNTSLNEAIKVAINFISYRPRTLKEIKDKLISKDFSSEVIEETIDFLVKSNYINDEDFAYRWAEERIVSKKLSKNLVKFELKAKGISDELIERTFDMLEIDEVENACNFLRNKFLKVKSKDSLDANKLLKILLSKGYSFNDSKRAIKKFFENY